MARKKPQLDWGPKGAWVLPKTLMENHVFRSLSPSAMKILMVLGSQYNGKNNGDLAATHRMMEAWGGMAEGTLGRALGELLDSGLVIKSRNNYKGRDGARCALYALNWLWVDECIGKDLEISATTKPGFQLR